LLNSKSLFRAAKAALISVFTLSALSLVLLIYANNRLEVVVAPLPDSQAAIVRSLYQQSSGTNKQDSSLYPLLKQSRWIGPEPTLIPSRKALAQDVHARSAILISADTGEILFEKNADISIPPASMTKLVAMYTALKAVESGEIQLDQEIIPPEESWAKNIPAGSSLMFLGPDQKVTIRELLEGMAVVSGNDAAIALAMTLCGSVDSFVERMNRETAALGLHSTSFVEPSGLSEYNRTTSREFAAFSRLYINRYPQTLSAFHSRRELVYPMPHNTKAPTEVQGIRQSATNKLLESLDGCDGLKTGFIYESGFNLALTCMRNGQRFIAVFMGGPGSNSREGNRFRVQDGSSVMEWAFSNWRHTTLEYPDTIPIPVWGGSEDGLHVLRVFDTPALIPVLADGIPTDGNTLVPHLKVPPYLEAPVIAGTIIGTIDWEMNGKVVLQEDVIADRTITVGSAGERCIDFLALQAVRLISVR